MIRLRWLAPLLLLASGCGAGKSAVLVTVNSLSTITGIATLHATLTNNGQFADVDLPIPNPPVSVPPQLSFGLSFDKSRSGAVTIVIDAADLADTILASGVGTTTVSSSQSSSVTITLAASAPPCDGGTCADDMMGAVDLAAPPDSAAAPDLAATADLTTSGYDLAIAPDLSDQPDLVGGAPGG